MERYGNGDGGELIARAELRTLSRKAISKIACGIKPFCRAYFCPRWTLKLAAPVLDNTPLRKPHPPFFTPTEYEKSGGNPKRNILKQKMKLKLKLPESSPVFPARPETPNDGHLAGLLTYASPNLKRLPGSSQWHVVQVLSEYSCGAVADSHRASQYQMEKSYSR